MQIFTNSLFIFNECVFWYRCILMGRHNMEVWYQSPYPEDAARLPKLYLCEFCLRYQKSEVGMKRHAAKCVWRHPPGDEVNFCVFCCDFVFFVDICMVLFIDLSQTKIRRLASRWEAT